MRLHDNANMNRICLELADERKEGARLRARLGEAKANLSEHELGRGDSVKQVATPRHHPHRARAGQGRQLLELTPPPAQCKLRCLEHCVELGRHSHSTKHSRATATSSSVNCVPEHILS